MRVKIKVWQFGTRVEVKTDKTRLDFETDNTSDIYDILSECLTLTGLCEESKREG